MTVNFQPDTVLFNDPAGWGHWLDGHALEHDVINQKLLALGVTIPQFNLLFWDDSVSVVQSWLQAHATAHQLIDSALNITSIDFSEVDLTQEDEFYDWTDDHAAEHQTIRTLLGIT